jgi:hypothetical protein
MAKNGGKQNGKISEAALLRSLEIQRLGNAAVHRAQDENRKLNIPNWYSVGGKIVSDQNLNQNGDQTKPQE